MGKYFVTGGTGFIGRHLVLELLGKGYDVVALARSGSKDRRNAMEERAAGLAGRG